MNAHHPLHQTPRERLLYVASESKPYRHEVAPRNYLAAIGLLVLILSMIAVGISAGMVGSELFGQCAQRITELIVP